MWFLNRSDTNRAVQPQKTVRDLKFSIYEEEKLYFPSRENKGADQLRGYREADLRMQIVGFLMRRLILPFSIIWLCYTDIKYTS